MTRDADRPRPDKPAPENEPPDEPTPEPPVPFTIPAFSSRRPLADPVPGPRSFAPPEQDKAPGTVFPVALVMRPKAPAIDLESPGAARNQLAQVAASLRAGVPPVEMARVIEDMLATTSSP